MGAIKLEAISSSTLSATNDTTYTSPYFRGLEELSSPEQGGKTQRDAKIMRDGQTVSFGRHIYNPECSFSTFLLSYNEVMAMPIAILSWFWESSKLMRSII